MLAHEKNLSEAASGWFLEFERKAPWGFDEMADPDEDTPERGVMRMSLSAGLVLIVKTSGFEEMRCSQGLPFVSKKAVKNAINTEKKGGILTGEKRLIRNAGESLFNLAHKYLFTGKTPEEYPRARLEYFAHNALLFYVRGIAAGRCAIDELIEQSFLAPSPMPAAVQAERRTDDGLLIPPGAEFLPKSASLAAPFEYRSHCWNCGDDIVGFTKNKKRCSTCGWFVCVRCGHCGCGRNKS